MNTTEVIEQVKIELATEMGDHSRAKVSVSNDDTNEAYVSNSVEMNVSADADDNLVWVNIRQNTYVSVGGAFSGQTFTTHHDLISHHFTKAEAKALLEILANELSKLD
jgi:hypothetical protein